MLEDDVPSIPTTDENLQKNILSIHNILKGAGKLRGFTVHYLESVYKVSVWFRIFEFVPDSH